MTGNADSSDEPIGKNKANFPYVNMNINEGGLIIVCIISLASPNTFQ